MSVPSDPRGRYRTTPTVLEAVRSPKLLTKEVLGGLLVGMNDATTTFYGRLSGGMGGDL